MGSNQNVCVIQLIVIAFCICYSTEPVYGDAEYFAAFRSIVIPIAKEFEPNIILVSAGFDAAAGHSPALGGYQVTAACKYQAKE